ncbi:MAG: hypothetical protein KDJ47_11755 [Hyphomicrobiaceae bacterium]|nr:hypothetical protein [Hyphomicrobiaceae bacterium]
MRLFSPEWMVRFRDAWNAEPALSGALGKIGFDSTIGYGFCGEPSPRGILIIENGRAVAAKQFGGETLDWDLRADPETWAEWLERPPGMVSLGMAYASSRLQFVTGDYVTMIKEPSMAGPFLKSFYVMARV